MVLLLGPTHTCLQSSHLLSGVWLPWIHGQGEREPWRAKVSNRTSCCCMPWYDTHIHTHTHTHMHTQTPTPTPPLCTHTYTQTPNPHIQIPPQLAQTYTHIHTCTSTLIHTPHTHPHNTLTHPHTHLRFSILSSMSGSGCCLTPMVSCFSPTT